MNPGPVEEASKVAQSVTEVFKSTPVLLMILLFNCAFMAMMVYLHIASTTRWDGEVERWSRLVASCLPPQQQP